MPRSPLSSRASLPLPSGCSYCCATASRADRPRCAIGRIDRMVPCRTTRTESDVRVLVACAVAAERDAILAAAPDAEVLVTGVGSAAAAAAASAALARARYDLVVSAGIGGGFGELRAGDVAVASS